MLTAARSWCDYSQRRVLICAGGVQGVDSAVAVVVAAAVELFPQLHGHFPVAQRHVFAVPDVHLAAKVEHQDLTRGRDRKKKSVICLVDLYPVPFFSCSV